MAAQVTNKSVISAEEEAQQRFNEQAKLRAEEELEFQRQLRGGRLPNSSPTLDFEPARPVREEEQWADAEASRTEDFVPTPNLDTFLFELEETANTRHVLVGDWFRPEGDPLRPDLEKVEARSLTSSLSNIAHELRELGEMIKEAFPILQGKSDVAPVETYSRPAFHRAAVITAPTIASTTPEEVAEVSVELSALKGEVASELENAPAMGSQFGAVIASLQYVNEALEDLSIVETQLGQKLKVSVDPDARSYLDSVIRMKSDLEAVQRDLFLITEIYTQLN